MRVLRHLDRQLVRLLETGFRRVIVDLRELTFIDSSGIRLLVKFDKRARRDGIEFALIERPAAVRRVLAMCGVAECFAMVGIKAKYYGKGPVGAKAFLADRNVFVVLEGADRRRGGSARRRQRRRQGRHGPLVPPDLRKDSATEAGT